LLAFDEGMRKKLAAAGGQFAGDIEKNTFKRQITVNRKLKTANWIWKYTTTRNCTTRRNPGKSIYSKV